MRHNALINNRKIFTRRVVYEMDTEETSQNVPKALIFSSPEGHTLCWLILAALLPYEPHDFQIEGICQTLDGVDLFAILATGMGQTVFPYTDNALAYSRFSSSNTSQIFPCQWLLKLKNSRTIVAPILTHSAFWRDDLRDTTACNPLELCTACIASLSSRRLMICATNNVRHG